MVISLFFLTFFTRKAVQTFRYDHQQLQENTLDASSSHVKQTNCVLDKSWTRAQHKQSHILTLSKNPPLQTLCEHTIRLLATTHRTLRVHSWVVSKSWDNEETQHSWQQMLYSCARKNNIQSYLPFPLGGWICAVMMLETMNVIRTCAFERQAQKSNFGGITEVSYVQSSNMARAVPALHKHTKK